MKLTAKMEPFDSFWEAPDDIEKGYDRFQKFYRHNYLKYIPSKKSTRLLVVSCGFGYFVNLLRKEGYANVCGIDSDSEKVNYANDRGLDCQREDAFEFMEKNENRFDVIIAEQEINHLTTDEILIFLGLCKKNLNENGTLIVHSLNGANPITGSESLAQNIDHYNTFTEYSLKQILEHAGFHDIHIAPLNLYVFYSNPLNYVAMLISALNELFFKINFKLYGKSNKIFTKKIAAICRK